MIKFIFSDKRYTSVETPALRARSALIIMLDFIASKISEAVSWLITFAAAYLLFTVFYSNMVLLGSLYTRQSGLLQILYALGFVAALIIFVLFAGLILAYILSSVLSFFSVSSATSALDKTKAVQKIKNQGVYKYGQGLVGKAGALFAWTPSGRNRNIFLLLAFSVFAFYWTWSSQGRASYRKADYHVLPDFLLVTARDLYATTYPTIAFIINYLWDLLGAIWGYIAGQLSALGLF